MSKYIKVDDLQRYCDNQKDHSITPNEFQRMTQYDFGWQTGTPTDEGYYLITNGDRMYDVGYYALDSWGVGRIPPEDIVAWQKINPFKKEAE